MSVMSATVEKELERSPKGRYTKLEEEIGRDSFKVVYKAYDATSGSMVAWNEVQIKALPPTDKKRVVIEVKILERIKHHRIISFHGSWYDPKNHKVIFITDLLTEGTLHDFCDKVDGLNLFVVRKWASQILEALIYLHSQQPPIIHRDVKCENVSDIFLKHFRQSIIYHLSFIMYLICFTVNII